MKQSAQEKASGVEAIDDSSGGLSEDQGGTSSARGSLRPDSYLRSLEKGLAVLHAFSPSKPQLTITEVAHRTGQDRAAARRAMLTLTQLGYLVQEGKTFRLTARVLGFSYQYLAALPFWQQAHPVLEALSDEMNETISIGVLDGQDVVFVLRVPAKRLLTFDPSTGTRVPAQVHSIGHVLLAGLQDQEFERFISNTTFTRFTAASIVNDYDLRCVVATARQQNWAFASSQHEENLGGVSVPLRDARGQMLAALNVNFIMDSDSRRRAVEDLLPRLQLAARRIQEAMPEQAINRGRAYR
ncbi:IclR family transcriptional regulator C-terminal domain-containing protein [Paraburkholderia sp. JHI2823]|uniref:IclR family transcriptional regulator domain-containing protein n=1 Tax=Paraburkholderia sp. JHI2823 TaxID=3112960 RepID=UPI00317E7B86